MCVFKRGRQISRQRRLQPRQVPKKKTWKTWTVWNPLPAVFSSHRCLLILARAGANRSPFVPCEYFYLPLLLTVSLHALIPFVSHDEKATQKGEKGQEGKKRKVNIIGGVVPNPGGLANNSASRWFKGPGFERECASKVIPQRNVHTPTRLRRQRRAQTLFLWPLFKGLQRRSWITAS